jgi:hypothetical protein
LSRKSLNDSIMKINGKKFIEDIGILIAQEKEQEQKQNSVHNPLAESDSQSCATKTLSSTEVSHYFLVYFRNMDPLNTWNLYCKFVSGFFLCTVKNHKQIERRLPDGRRRITPICIAKTNE